VYETLDTVAVVLKHITNIHYL